MCSVLHVPFPFFLLAKISERDSWFARVRYVMTTVMAGKENLNLWKGSRHFHTQHVVTQEIVGIHTYIWGTRSAVRAPRPSPPLLYGSGSGSRSRRTNPRACPIDWTEVVPLFREGVRGHPTVKERYVFKRFLGARRRFRRGVARRRHAYHYYDYWRRRRAGGPGPAAAARGVQDHPPGAA